MKKPKFKVGDTVVVNHGYGARDIKFTVDTISANHGGANAHRYWGEDARGCAHGAYEDQILRKVVP